MAKKKSEETPLSPSTETSPQMGPQSAGAGERNLGGEEVKVYFTPESWKGVKTVFKCATCGTFRDERDAMIEHVLLHFPKGEQERVFEELMKE